MDGLKGDDELEVVVDGRTEEGGRSFLSVEGGTGQRDGRIRRRSSSEVAGQDERGK